MIIRRPAEPIHGISNYSDYVELNKTICLLVKLENDIDNAKYFVSDIMKKIISKIKNKEERNKAILIRRRAYNNINFIYETNIFDDYSNSKYDLAFLKMDLHKRKVLTELEINCNYKLLKLNECIKSTLNKLYYDSTFMNKLYVSNKILFNSITLTNGPKKKSHYITLLKYLYKQENCCTPSSLWSGLTYSDDCPHLNEVIFAEYNRTRLKFDLKKNIIQHWNEYSLKEDINFYVNLTLWHSGGYYYVFDFEEESIQKLKLKTNIILDTLYNNFRFKLFKINELRTQYDTLFSSNVLLELITLSIIRPESPLPYGDSGSQVIKTNHIKDDNNKIYDNFNIRFENFCLKEEIKQSIINTAKAAFNSYICLYDTFFQNYYFGKDYIKLTDFLAENDGEMTLIEFLYSDFKFTISSSKSLRKARAWTYSSQNEDSFNLFLTYVNNIVDTCLNHKIVRISLKDLDWLILKKNNEYQNTIETVFQYDHNSTTIIPEMISLTPGRFLGRYCHFFPEVEDEIYKTINDPNNVQVNVEINSPKDNISFDNPNAEKRIILFDLDSRTIERSSTIYTMNDIILSLKDGDIILRDKSGTNLKINCASTLSPGKSKIYQLFAYLSNIDSCKAPLGGTAFSRLELDRDYQPRIILDNLLLSRERWRILKKDIDLTLNNLLSFLKWKNKLNLPDEVYVYTDTVEKPYYCRFGTDLDLAIFKEISKSADCYIYIEEVYPDINSNIEFTSYNMEVLYELCLN